MPHISDEYFEWLVSLVCTQRYSKDIYRKLLTRLHSTEFRYTMRRDQNRAENGETLRYIFAIAYDYDVENTLIDLGNPCSVLEMMIALARHCEDIAEDPAYGNRTSQWFWNMITNMDLGTMTDEFYDEVAVGQRINRFLDREYEPDGKGGLFRIRDCQVDLRRIDIWRQLCWYLNTIM